MTSPSEPQGRTPRKLDIDLEKLVSVMDTGGSIELQGFLDLTNGAIVVLAEDLLRRAEEDEELDDLPDWERSDIEIARRINDGDKQLIEVAPFGSDESLRIMADFVAGLSDDRARARLEDAMSRPKPFRRLKDALLEFPKVRERWFAFEAERKGKLAREWLRELGIEAVAS